MASRHDPRLPHAVSSLVTAAVRTNLTQTGRVGEEELVRICPSRESATGRTPANANTSRTLPRRNVDETDHAPESCQTSYQAQDATPSTCHDLSHSTPANQCERTTQNDDPALESDRTNDDVDGSGEVVKRTAPQTWPAQRQLATEKLVDGLEESFGESSLSQSNSTSACETDESLVDPALRIQVSSPARTSLPHLIQRSSSASNPTQFSDNSGSTNTFSQTQANLNSARAEFENYTQVGRSLSRASTHDMASRNDEAEDILANGYPRISMQSNMSPFMPSTPSDGNPSHLTALLASDHVSTQHVSDQRTEIAEEKPAFTTVDRSVNLSAAALESGNSLNVDEETTLTVQESSTNSKYRSYLQQDVVAGRLMSLDYRQLVPEVLPADYTNITHLRTAEEKRRKQLQHLAYRLPWITAEDVAPLFRSGELQMMLEASKTAWPMFPRVFSPQPIKISPNAPPICPPRSTTDAWPDNIPIDLLEQLATTYLSQADVRNLRLVNKQISASFTPIYFRSLVARFGVHMFAPLQQYGDFVNKFGISFEVDVPALYRAKPKISQEVQHSWWGKYNWPKSAYQRYPELKALEDLVDENKPLLKKTLQNLSDATELALSIDSGHGWLNGPDLSDMQVWDSRHNGSKVFGQRFKAADKWEEHLRNELFRWAQQNTINQSIKYLVERSTTENVTAFNRTRSKLRWLRSVQIRDYKTFEAASQQFDQDENQHTGGSSPPAPAQGQAPQIQLGNALVNPMGNAPPNNNPPPAPGAAVQIPPAIGTWQAQLQLQQNLPGNHGILPAAPGGAVIRQRMTSHRLRSARPRTPLPKKSRGPHVPQWPPIFNGYNLAAEVGGQNTYVQEKIANPASALIKPGQLSEAQAQWLMETVWAQRAFLSAYTTSVILNKPSLGRIHTLNIAKLSSGLLPLLEQHEFWRALPGLKTFTIMISPDWRKEHIPGDQAFQSNMLISPIDASIKLTDFLQRFICNLENLSELNVGYVGGGEHAPGMLARNQHVLPAPVTQEPRAWVSDHHSKPPVQSMISFNHIKKLKFSNCWFSPCMLLAFMDKSRDTSLSHLILDSVSLTAHGASSVGSSGTAMPIDALHGRESWLNEMLPNKGCWPAILDEITPGMTFLEQKEALGFHLNEESEQLLRTESFRGNVQEITLNSCGYVQISGVMVEELNQSQLLRAQSKSLDEGLVARKQSLQIGQNPPRSRRLRPAQPGNANPLPIPVIDSRPGTPQDISGRLMMSTNDAHGHEYFGLGTLTQAVHPVEKRVLEQGWAIRFGWGDDMNRWSAVDDGFYECGTGRFSGSILK